MTEIQFRSETAIPCALLASLDATARPLAGARFSGVIDLRLQNQSWKARFTNVEFANIDLGQATLDSPASITGLGTLFLNQAQFSPSQLDSAEGLLSIGPGRIATDFLVSIQRHLGIQLRQVQSVQTQAFDTASVAFHIRPRTVQLWGGMPDGIMLADAIGPLAARNAQTAIPVGNLVHALAAGRDGTSPEALTRLVRTALVWLPIEDAQRQQASSVLRLSRIP